MIKSRLSTSDTEKKIISQNEGDANRKVAVVMFFTFCIYSVMYILDLLGIFVVPLKSFTVAYITSAVLLLFPLLLNRILTPYNKALKHLYIFGTGAFLFISIVTLSYHSTVVYILPVAVAGIYFSKRDTRLSIMLTVVVTIAGQIVSYKLNLLNDANFADFSKMILFGVFPRTCALMAMLALMYMINRRTTKLISDQIIAAEQIKAHNQETVMLCASLLESHDSGTGGHLRRTREYVNILLSELKKAGLYKDILTNDFIENVVLVSPLHDIGKNSISNDILDVNRKLTPEEFEVMKTHTTEGGKIIENSFSDIGSGGFKQVAKEVALYHHEKWDGTGYPQGLKQEEIPLSARVMAVADVFDAISSDRPYRKAMTMDECFGIIEKGIGTHFDPVLAKVFLENREEIIEIRNKINKQQ